MVVSEGLVAPQRFVTATLLSQENNMEPTTHKPMVRPTLAQAEALIGGCATLVFEQRGMQVLADEQGLMKSLELNTEATELCGVRIIGNAIILTGDSRWT